MSTIINYLTQSRSNYLSSREEYLDLETLSDTRLDYFRMLLLKKTSFDPTTFKEWCISNDNMDLFDLAINDINYLNSKKFLEKKEGIYYFSSDSAAAKLFSFQKKIIDKNTHRIALLSQVQSDTYFDLLTKKNQDDFKANILIDKEKIEKYLTFASQQKFDTFGNTVATFMQTDDKKIDVSMLRSYNFWSNQKIGDKKVKVTDKGNSFRYLKPVHDKNNSVTAYLIKSAFDISQTNITIEEIGLKKEKDLVQIAIKLEDSFRNSSISDIQIEDLAVLDGKKKIDAFAKTLSDYYFFDDDEKTIFTYLFKKGLDLEVSLGDFSLENIKNKLANSISTFNIVSTELLLDNITKENKLEDSFYFNLGDKENKLEPENIINENDRAEFNSGVNSFKSKKISNFSSSVLLAKEILENEDSVIEESFENLFLSMKKLTILTGDFKNEVFTLESNLTDDEIRGIVARDFLSKLVEKELLKNSIDIKGNKNEFTRNKKSFGWKHKDTIRQLHDGKSKRTILEDGEGSDPIEISNNDSGESIGSNESSDERGDEGKRSLGDSEYRTNLYTELNIPNEYADLFKTAQYDTFEHTKTHEVLDVMKLKDKLTKEEFKTFNKFLSKEKLGYYSRVAKAFIITNKEIVIASKSKEANSLVADSKEEEAEIVSSMGLKIGETAHTQKESITFLGKNLDEGDVYVDSNGVRSYNEKDSNFTMSDKVSLIAGVGISTTPINEKFSNGDFKLLTVEEIRSFAEEKKNVKELEEYLKDELISHGIITKTFSKDPSELNLDEYDMFLEENYPDMNLLDREKYQDMIDNRLQARSQTLANHFGFTYERIEDWLKYAKFTESSNETNVIGMSIFGVEDNFKNINIYADEIAQTKAYKAWKIEDNIRIASENKIDASFQEINFETGLNFNDIALDKSNLSNSNIKKDGNFVEFKITFLIDGELQTNKLAYNEDSKEYTYENSAEIGLKPYLDTFGDRIDYLDGIYSNSKSIAKADNKLIKNAEFIKAKTGVKYEIAHFQTATFLTDKYEFNFDDGGRGYSLFRPIEGKEYWSVKERWLSSDLNRKRFINKIDEAIEEEKTITNSIESTIKSEKISNDELVEIIKDQESAFNFSLEGKELKITNLKEFYSTDSIDNLFIKEGVMWEIFADKYIFDLSNKSHVELLKNELKFKFKNDVLSDPFQEKLTRIEKELDGIQDVHSFDSGELIYNQIPLDSEFHSLAKEELYSIYNSDLFKGYKSVLMTKILALEEAEGLKSNSPINLDKDFKFMIENSTINNFKDIHFKDINELNYYFRKIYDAAATIKNDGTHDTFNIWLTTKKDEFKSFRIDVSKSIGSFDPSVELLSDHLANEYTNYSFTREALEGLDKNFSVDSFIKEWVDIERTAMSVTQRNATLYYNHKEIISYDDKVTLTDGNYVVTDSSKWFEVAERLYYSGDERNNINPIIESYNEIDYSDSDRNRFIKNLMRDFEYDVNNEVSVSFNGFDDFGFTASFAATNEELIATRISGATRIKDLNLIQDEFNDFSEKAKKEYDDKLKEYINSGDLEIHLSSIDNVDNIADGKISCTLSHELSNGTRLFAKNEILNRTELLKYLGSVNIAAYNDTLDLEDQEKLVKALYASEDHSNVKGEENSYRIFKDKHNNSFTALFNSVNSNRYIGETTIIEGKDLNTILNKIKSDFNIKDKKYYNNLIKDANSSSELLNINQDLNSKSVKKIFNEPFLDLTELLELSDKKMSLLTRVDSINSLYLRANKLEIVGVDEYKIWNFETQEDLKSFKTLEELSDYVTSGEYKELLVPRIDSYINHNGYILYAKHNNENIDHPLIPKEYGFNLYTGTVEVMKEATALNHNKYDNPLTEGLMERLGTYDFKRLKDSFKSVMRDNAEFDNYKFVSEDSFNELYSEWFEKEYDKFHGVIDDEEKEEDHNVLFTDIKKLLNSGLGYSDFSKKEDELVQRAENLKLIYELGDNFTELKNLRLKLKKSYVNNFIDEALKINNIEFLTEKYEELTTEFDDINTENAAEKILDKIVDLETDLEIAPDEKIDLNNLHKFDEKIQLDFLEKELRKEENNRVSDDRKIAMLKNAIKPLADSKKSIKNENYQNLISECNNKKDLTRIYYELKSDFSNSKLKEDDYSSLEKLINSKFEKFEDKIKDSHFDSICSLRSQGNNGYKKLLEDYNIKYNANLNDNDIVIDKEVFELHKRVSINQLTRSFNDGKDIEIGVSEHNKIFNDSFSSSDIEEDFVIENDISKGGAKTKFKNYIAAIEVVRKVENNDSITKEEKEVLSKMPGIGTIAQAFPRSDGSVVKGWEKEAEELKVTLSDAEYEQAARATLDAYYTDENIVKAMWKGIDGFGFNGGSVIEPSCGAGNFFGYMPSHLKPNAKIIGIELDETTSKVAKTLYPKAKIYNLGFQDFRLKKGQAASVVIGNPPYGSHKLYDESLPNLSGKSIHNFFMGKSAELLDEGGIMAMVVSSNFLDNKDSHTRGYIASTSNLVGAIRLPKGSFGNANTEIVTDIVFFKKRELGEESNINEWLNIGSINDTPINAYFENNPENLLGIWGKYGTMYSGDEPALVEAPEQDTNKLLSEAIERLPKNIFSEKTNTLALDFANEGEKTVSNARINSYYLNDDKIFKRLPDFNGEVVTEEVTTKLDSKDNIKDLTDTEIDRMKKMIGIVEVANKLRTIQLLHATTEDELNNTRNELNELYDTFVKKHGFLNKGVNKRLFEDDVNSPFLLALEKKYDKGITRAAAKKHGVDPIKESAQKADIFFQRTQKPYEVPTSADSFEDALHISLSEKAYVDMNFMSNLLDKEVEEIEDYLSSNDFIFDDPSDGWVTKEEYLSGNVKSKLKETNNYKNIEALEKVIPEDIAAIDINVSCGASWIPKSDMSDFVKEITGTEDSKPYYISYNATWTVPNIVPSSDKESILGTKRYPLKKVLAAALNSKQATVYDTIDDGVNKTKVINQEETTAANDKIEQVKEIWSDWIWNSADRRERLAKLYNEKFNVYARREYDGSHLKLSGKVDDSVIDLRPHQKNAVWRTLQNGRDLMDHTVGSGKTYTGVASIMELKRTGKAKKPLVVVPNHLVQQWSNEWLDLYPNANLLVPTKKDFEKKRRKILMSRIATGEYDAIIIAHSQLEKIENDRDFEVSFIKEQIKEIKDAINEVRKEDGKAGLTIKQWESKKAALEDKIKLLMKKDKDDNLDFSELGIDALLVDEAHMFKNLQFHTSLQRIRGLGNPQGSQKAFDMYLKTQFLLEKTGNKNLIFLTGTPISNSIAELYTLKKYLMSDELKQDGLQHFDSWAKQYAEIKTDWELAASGKYKLVTRMSKFKNMPELIAAYNTFTDVVTTEMVKEQLSLEGKTLDIPAVKNGKPKLMVVDRSEDQANYIGVEDEKGEYEKGTLVYRSEHMPKGKPKKGDDNALVVMSDAKKASLDMRLIDPYYDDYKDSKVNNCIEDLVSNYEKWEDIKGVQLIFCDLSTPKGAKAGLKAHIEDLETRAENGDDKALTELSKFTQDELSSLYSDFSVYDDVKAKLLDKGIPAAEIAFIHDAKTDLQKEELFLKVNSGAIRFLMGSTSKMGAGMNVQKRLVSLSHLDVPWRPSDLEQREGRIIRQGNLIFKLYKDLKDNEYSFDKAMSNLKFRNLIEELNLSSDKIENIVNKAREHGEDFDVEITRYATKNTLDSGLWEKIEAKAKFIQQLKAGELLDREVEDISGEEANAAEMKAASSGNPLILEDMQLKTEIKKLEALKKNFNRSLFDRETSIKNYETALSNFDGEDLRFRKDIENVYNHKSLVASKLLAHEKLKTENKKNGISNKNLKAPADIIFNANGKTFEKREPLGEYIMLKARELKHDPKTNVKEIEIGEIANFKISIEKANTFNENLMCLVASGEREYLIDFHAMDQKPLGLAIRLLNEFDRIEAAHQKLISDNSKIIKELPNLKNLPTVFPRDEELQLLRKRHRVVISKLKGEDKKKDANVESNTDAQKPISNIQNNWIDENKDVSTDILLSKNRLNLEIMNNLDYEFVANCLVINEQLERKDYNDFRKVFEVFGGVWDRKKSAIVFSEDGLVRMKEALKFCHNYNDPNSSKELRAILSKEDKDLKIG